MGRTSNPKETHAVSWITYLLNTYYPIIIVCFDKNRVIKTYGNLTLSLFLQKYLFLSILPVISYLTTNMNWYLWLCHGRVVDRDKVHILYTGHLLKTKPDLT